jgi:hypothetical protein
MRFSRQPMRSKVRVGSETEWTMRLVKAAVLIAAGAVLSQTPARADWVWEFKGNDTGGIIAYELAQRTDARQLAVDHCAKFGKVVKFLAVDAQYGGYLSFSCRWVPYGANEAPLHTKY